MRAERLGTSREGSREKENAKRSEGEGEATDGAGAGGGASSGPPAKRIRARDGCLGTVRRRRARQAAKIRGEGQAPSDPRVPEWGNPARPARRPPANTWPAGATPGEVKHLSTRRRGNQRETARVAASESATAQTGAHAPRGCGTAGGRTESRPNALESAAEQGESPVGRGAVPRRYPE